MSMAVTAKFLGNSKPFVVVVVTVPFLGTALAISSLWHRGVEWADLVLLIAMYTVTLLGGTVGFHRMLTHRSFCAHPGVKLLLLVLGSMVVLGPPIEWAATHIKHHSQSDREDDPHSPLAGLFHAHMGWLFKDRFPHPQTYCPHLLRDPIVVFVNRTYLLWVALSLAIPLAIGGWTGLVWGGLVRIFFGHHVSFSVNSVCHAFGTRQFTTNDCSRNNWLVALLTFGEGWHNNHHAFPRSAFHGLRWWQVDVSGYIILLLERLGLVYDVHRVPPNLLARTMARTQQSSPENRLRCSAHREQENEICLLSEIARSKPSHDHSDA
jgi:stearoyl-CoA desaturase (Delta-9 desaturase)